MHWDADVEGSLKRGKYDYMNNEKNVREGKGDQKERAQPQFFFPRPPPPFPSRSCALSDL